MNCKAKPWNSVSIFMPISSCRSTWSWCPPALLVSCLRNLHHMPWKWQSMYMVVVYCSASLNTVPKNLNSLRWWNRCWARFQILRNFSRILLEAPWIWSGPQAPQIPPVHIPGLKMTYSRLMPPYAAFHLYYTYYIVTYPSISWYPSITAKDTNDSVRRLYPISIQFSKKAS